MKKKKKKKKKRKNSEKVFCFFQIIASEFVALNCFYQAYNACHRQSMCQQTVFGFCMSLKGTFFDVITFTVINKYGKQATIQIATVFRPICHVVCRRVL